MEQDNVKRFHRSNAKAVAFTTAMLKSSACSWSMSYKFQHQTQKYGCLAHVCKDAIHDNYYKVCRCSLLSGQNVHSPHCMLPAGESRWVCQQEDRQIDERTDAKPLHYAFCYGRGQHNYSDRILVLGSLYKWSNAYAFNSSAVNPETIRTVGNFGWFWVPFSVLKRWFSEKSIWPVQKTSST